MNSWLFSGIEDLEKAKRCFDSLGFCVFSKLMSEDSILQLVAAVDEAINEKRLHIGESSLESNNDAIYAHSEIEHVCRNKILVKIVRTFLDCDIELQHAKFNAKPRNDKGMGEVKWHQDFPFFPHTNFDLCACIIHLDNESAGSGAMEFIPGSHKNGVASHLSEDGLFEYQCTDGQAISFRQPELIIAKRGWISFHHGLTLHRSAPKVVEDDRRLLVFQYRAIDAVQVAGVIWKCNGYQVQSLLPTKKMVRFPCGTRVEMRGVGGRLYDLFGTLGPDKPVK